MDVSECVTCGAADCPHLVRVLADFWIEPDGDGDETVWRKTGKPFGPDAVVRRCDVSADAWALITRDIGSTDA